VKEGENLNRQEGTIAQDLAPTYIVLDYKFTVTFDKAGGTRCNDSEKAQRREAKEGEAAIRNLFGNRKLHTQTRFNFIVRLILHHYPLYSLAPRLSPSVASLPPTIEFCFRPRLRARLPVF
jgi:hypothetical protein